MALLVPTSRLESLPTEILQLILSHVVPSKAPVVWRPTLRLLLNTPGLSVSHTIRNATIKAVYDYSGFALEDPHDIAMWLANPRILKFDVIKSPHPSIPRYIMLSICTRMIEHTPKVDLDWDNADSTHSLITRADDLDNWKSVWRGALVKIPFRRRGQDEDRNAHYRVTKIIIDVSLHWLYTNPGNMELFVGYICMVVQMRSQGLCKVQIVGCQNPKEQKSFESYVPAKQLYRTGRAEGLEYFEIAEKMEKKRATDITFFGTLFEP